LQYSYNAKGNIAANIITSSIDTNILESTSIRNTGV